MQSYTDLNRLHCKVYGSNNTVTVWAVLRFSQFILNPLRSLVGKCPDHAYYMTFNDPSVVTQALLAHVIGCFLPWWDLLW